MILAADQLRNFAGQLTMVDGSFDPIHEGHVAYFAAAAEFGFPVLCNVTHDEWTESKHAVLLSQSRRGIVLDSIRYLSFVHLSSISTHDVLELLRPRMYVKGNDWLKRGGVPENERLLCEKLGIEIKYVDTVLNSSSQILSEWSESRMTEQNS
ncbi:MAG: nucleotidyl transferase family protein [Ilumatobacteraceae bacterium]